MEDASTDDSSDELCSSYKTYAKHAYEAALKRAAEVVITPDTLIFSDDSSDSENHQPFNRKGLKIKENAEVKVSPDTLIVSDDSSDSENQPFNRKGLKRKENKKNIRITRSKKRKESASKTATKEEEEDCVVLSSDSDTLNSLVVEKGGSSIPTNICTPRRKINDLEDELDYDTEPDEKTAKETVTLSDSSDIEEFSSPIINKNNVYKDNNELMSIKISWRFQPIQKFQLRRHQKFKTLLEHFAKLEGVPIEQVVVHGGKDNWRSVEPYDTPDSIGVTIADVLEGGILSKGSMKHSSLSKRYRDPSETDGEEIELRVQQEQTRSFPLLVKRHQKMKVLFIKVAEQVETDLDKVKLFLDGEVIDPDSTPNSLDLDNGDVLDMVIA